jgi:hypothetical protein
MDRGESADRNIRHIRKTESRYVYRHDVRSQVGRSVPIVTNGIKVPNRIVRKHMLLAARMRILRQKWQSAATDPGRMLFEIEQIA